MTPVRTSAGLNLDRQSLKSGGRKKPGRLSHIAGPVVVGLVFIFMGAWLAFSYFMPDAETTAAVLPPAQTVPPPVQTTKALGGRILPGGKPETNPVRTGMSSGAAAVLGTDSQKPNPTFVTDAAKSMISPYSQMGQVGLLLPQAKPQPAAKAKAPEPAPKAKASPQKTAQPQAVAAKPKPQAPAPAPKSETPPQTQAAAASSSLVDATSGASKGTSQPVAARVEREDTILGGGRDFTVHLGSFRDRKNAESYKSELVAAGEKAFVTETFINGQQWYRVTCGDNLKSRTAAETYGRDLKRRGLTTASSGQYFVKPID